MLLKSLIIFGNGWYLEYQPVFQVTLNPGKVIQINTSEQLINTSEVLVNTSEVLVNTSEVLINTSEVLVNTSEVLVNTSEVLINTSEVLVNTSEVLANTSEVLANTSEVLANTSEVPPCGFLGRAKDKKKGAWFGTPVSCLILCRLFFFNNCRCAFRKAFFQVFVNRFGAGHIRFGCLFY